MTWRQSIACDIMNALNIDSAEAADAWPDDNQNIGLLQARLKIAVQNTRRFKG
jgi:hypothetical protein